MRWCALTNLVDEYDGGRVLPGQAEHISDHARALAQVLLHKLAAHHRDERGRSSVRYCFRHLDSKAQSSTTVIGYYSEAASYTYHRLSGAGRAIEQHSPGRVDADLLVQLELREGQLHGFPHLQRRMNAQ